MSWLKRFVAWLKEPTAEEQSLTYWLRRTARERGFED